MEVKAEANFPKTFFPPKTVVPSQMLVVASFIDFETTHPLITIIIAYHQSQ
jgi:hypothetical protein